MVGSTTSYRDGSIIVGTGTLTLPPNITDTVVLLAANQTLTTKTLTAPTINGAAMSGTITGHADVQRQHPLFGLSDF